MTRSSDGSLSPYETKRLDRLYKNGSTAYGSVASLSKASGLSRAKVVQFLHSKASYTKFYPVQRNFRRLGAHSAHLNHTWSIDLAFVDKLATWNKSVKYLLVAVDNFSRFVRVEPIKNKSAETTKTAFEKMIRKVQPKTIWTDQGTEFGGVFKTLCKDLGIKLYHTFSENKACYAERAIRSLKYLIYRHLEETGSNNYIDRLTQLVSTMNNRKHRMLNKSPRTVTNNDALKVLYGGRKMLAKVKPKFKVGDQVRISKTNTPFEKGYKPRYSREIFGIAKVFNTDPITYNISDLSGEEIQGKFYEKELVLQN